MTRLMRRIFFLSLHFVSPITQYHALCDPLNMASEGTPAKDLYNAIIQFSSTGTLAPGVTKEELAEFVKQESKRSKAIDRQLTSELSKNKTEIILLLLGTVSRRFGVLPSPILHQPPIAKQFALFPPYCLLSCALPDHSNMPCSQPPITLARVSENRPDKL